MDALWVFVDTEDHPWLGRGCFIRLPLCHDAADYWHEKSPGLAVGALVPTGAPGLLP